MPLLRLQVSTYTEGGPFRDAVVNSFYLNVGPDFGMLTGDADTLCQDATEIWASDSRNLAGFNRVQCKAYDMAAPTPRPIVGQHTREAANHLAGVAPREVALCLSFYSERNLPRRRGRLFLGPWSTNQLAERPGTGVRNQVRDIGNAIAGLGGPNVDWNVWSPTDNAQRPVTHFWIDDEWDTMRSRGLRATIRDAYETGG